MIRYLMILKFYQNKFTNFLLQKQLVGGEKKSNTELKKKHKKRKEWARPETNRPTFSYHNNYDKGRIHWYRLVYKNYSRLLLFGKFFFTSLSFHLLHFNGIWFSSTHVQFMVTHTQWQNSLVDA